MSTLPLVQTAQAEHLLQLGEIIPFDFIAKTKKGEYTAFDAMSLSFPELLKKSGVLDEGEYLGKFHPHVKDTFWSRDTRNKLYCLVSDRADIHMSQYTVLWELLSVFIENKKKWRRFLKAGRRIISCSNDVYHGQGVFASLSAQGNRIVLKKIAVDGNTRWTPSDYFLGRIDPS